MCNHSISRRRARSAAVGRRWRGAWARAHRATCKPNIGLIDFVVVAPKLAQARPLLAITKAKRRSALIAIVI